MAPDRPGPSRPAPPSSVVADTVRLKFGEAESHESAPLVKRSTTGELSGWISKRVQRMPRPYLG